MKIITSKQFNSEVLEHQGVVMVDFYADWCGPCKMISPVLEQISAEVGSQAKILKLNIEHSREIASMYQVLSIPTLMLFKNGEQIGTIHGFQPKDVIKEKILNSI